MLRVQRGFSLIELVVVLTIICILAVVAIPSLKSLVQNQRLSSTAEKLFYDLQYARTEAIKRNATVYVSFQTGSSWCYGINSGSACNCTIANNCNIGSTAAAGSQQLTLTTTGFSSGTIQFEPIRGAASASGTATLTLFGGSNLITVTVGRLGSLQICATGVSGYTAC